MIVFHPGFSKRIYTRVLALLAGTILAIRGRTVTVALRVIGLAGSSSFGAYHRVLSYARCLPRKAARRLLLALVDRFASEGPNRSDPLVFGLDDTPPEHRRGGRIRAKDIYRDSVGSLLGRHTLWRQVKLSLRNAGGMPVVPLRWVLVCDPSGRLDTWYEKPHPTFSDALAAVHIVFCGNKVIFRDRGLT